MNRLLAIILIVLALAGGFLGGMAVPRHNPSPSSIRESGMTSYQRGQLMMQCYEKSIARPQQASPQNPRGLSARELCMEEIAKLP